MQKSIEQWDCFNCDEPVAVTVVTGKDEEAPELYMGPSGSFIGYTIVDYEDGPGDEPEFIVCCSEDCVKEMLSDDEDGDDAAEEEPSAEEEGLQ